MVFEEPVGLFLGGVEVPFRVGELAVERVAEDLLEMSETLLVAYDLEVVGFAEVLQLLDLLGGESVGGGYVGMTLCLEGVLGIEREGVEFALGHHGDETFQVVH